MTTASINNIKSNSRMSAGIVKPAVFMMKTFSRKTRNIRKETGRSTFTGLKYIVVRKMSRKKNAPSFIGWKDDLPLRG